MSKMKLKKSFFVSAAVVSASLLLCAGVANAREQTSAATPAPLTQCKETSLNGDRFLEMFHAIVMHGNMRDIPFIEKTLQVKFEVTKESESAHRTHYSVKSILNAPIKVDLDVWDNDAKLSKGSDIAIMRFGNSNHQYFFHSCLHIKQSKFKNYFGNQFGSNLISDSSDHSVYKQLSDVGLSKAKILLGYSDVKNSPLISPPYIRQLQ
jgi:hypothetical protein